MPPPFAFNARGVVAGVSFVSDGHIVLRADLVAPLAPSNGVADLPSEALGALLEMGPGARATRFEDLTKSASTPGAFRTPDGVGLGEKYVSLLGSLGRSLVLYSTTPTSRVIVVDRPHVIGVLMPVVLAPEVGTSPTLDALPPARTFPPRHAFEAAQWIGLLGAYDGGTWARAISRTYGIAAVSQPLTEDQIHELLLGEYAAQPHAVHSGGHAAELEGIFVASDLTHAEPAAVNAAVRLLAAKHGVHDVVLDDPSDLHSIFVALGRAFARAGVPQRVHLVGVRSPVILIRERLAPAGPFSPVRTFDPAVDAPRVAATFDGDALVQAFSNVVRASGTRVEHVAKLDRPATDAAPAHQVHALRRTLTHGNDESFFLVTIGLSRRPLANATGGTLARFELTTWTRRYDTELARTLSLIGSSLHWLAERGSQFELGHSFTTEPPGFLGWPRVLLSRLAAPIASPLGAVDIARVTPITNAEWAEKQALPTDVLGGFAYTTTLESRGFEEVLNRWHTPPRG